MGEQIRSEEWLPEGWKIEIRVRKSGKKDRYYTDPVNGYIFRSLKDIDRYLLSGKLGKHVTKNKPKGLDSDSTEMISIQHTDVPKKKKSIKSNGGKKLCETAAQGLKKDKSKPERERAGAKDSEEIEKKTISRSSKGGRSTSRQRRRRDSTPFFILDPDHCEDSSGLSIPNLSEIIDSMLKEKDGAKTVYLSAPAIGSLLGEKLSDTWTNNSNKKPKFAVNICKDNGINSNKQSCMPSDSLVKNEDWESRSVTRPYHLEPFPLECSNMSITESKPKEEGQECPGFVDLFDDPCIDFAIKTLTGNSSLGV
ncbi:hypothetical protein BVRB_3g066780 isoform A [Beta vulgaris subsp. vulgaris]|uniref:uncharacterized protein LOC104906467 n=1 Tax=Beta vulgaris subsp. vulgaris TaxID=3555 RepID=UPI00053F6E82|nr:uncharacterized protein LOC104906467 [Beta vulgaris subsp. vulgaris]KMS99078.1 hypothetical protein BVRB_3g066780 isoform A [Beta vulgaris subsp. vulgaris]